METQKLTGLLDELTDNYYNTYYQSSAGRGKARQIMTTTPSPLAIPYKWDYEKTKEMLYRLSKVLTPEEAERLNVQFENPGLRDMLPAAITPSTRGGIQLLLPGQKAPTHKHTANAFRLVMEAPKEGAYTVVNGVELPMHHGDLVLTPNWTWHDHHNDSDGDVIWFDGLDIILAYWIGGIFYSQPKGEQSPNNPGQSGNENIDEFGSGLVPDSVHEKPGTDPLFYYPYVRARSALNALAKKRSDSSSVTLEYTDPFGGPVFPSMGLKMTLVRAGKSTGSIRRTENAVFICMEGEGNISLATGESFDMKLHDIAVVPTWQEYTITSKASSDLVMFSYSDEPVFRALEMFRESK